MCAGSLEDARISTAPGSALGKLKMTCGWESRPANAVAGRPGPSLAGCVATHSLKRRQGSCGVRAESPERMKVVEAEAVPVAEGCTAVSAHRLTALGFKVLA